MTPVGTFSTNAGPDSALHQRRLQHEHRPGPGTAPAPTSARTPARTQHCTSADFSTNAGPDSALHQRRLQQHERRCGLQHCTSVDFSTNAGADSSTAPASTSARTPVRTPALHQRRLQHEFRPGLGSAPASTPARTPVRTPAHPLQRRLRHGRQHRPQRDSTHNPSQVPLSMGAARSYVRSSAPAPARQRRTRRCRRPWVAQSHSGSFPRTA